MEETAEPLPTAQFRGLGVQTITFGAGKVPAARLAPDGLGHSCTDDNSMGDAGVQNKPHLPEIHVGEDHDAVRLAHR